MLLQARDALARGDRGAALDVLRRAACSYPQLSAVQVEFGNLSLMHGDVAAAEAAYRRAIAADAGDWAAHVGLGNVLRESDQPEEAIAAYRRALDLAPGLAAIWYNLGLVLREVGRFPEAVDAYERALTIDSTRPATWYAKANALTGACRYGEAIAAYDQALRLKADYPEATFSQSMALLLDGQFARGWDLYEARWRARNFATPYRVPQLPQWQGEPLIGRHILVWGEQGIGDEVRFLSVLGEICGEARAVSYLGEKRLRSLIARAFPAVLLPETPGDQLVDTAGIDLQSPVGSLARFRRRALADFPAPPPAFLQPDVECRQSWANWLATLGDELKVGLSWRTGRNARRKQARYASVEQWAHALRPIRAQWVCLQYDQCDDDVAAFARSGLRVHVPPGLDRRDDFEGMAGLYVALDVIASAPNTVADFAGALGVHTWVVVHAPHWPWGIWPDTAGLGQPWYANLHMVDGHALGGWEPALATVAAALSTSLQTSRRPDGSR